MHDATAAALPVISCVIAAGMVLLPLLNRDPQRRRDLQLTLNSGRWGWRLLMGYAVVSVVGVILVALLLLPRFPSVWGMFPLAAATLYLVGYFVYIDRRPFPDDHIDGDGDERDG